MAKGHARRNAPICPYNLACQAGVQGKINDLGGFSATASDA
jgi:hypothetical protein